MNDMGHLDDLDLDLDLNGLTSRGRRAKILNPSIVRPLRVSDLVMLAMPSAESAPSVKRLSERHHGLARLLAAGSPPGEAAIVMGYDGARVSILQGDPAFKELVAFYTDRVDTEFMDTIGQIAGLNKDLIAEIRQRVEDDPSSISMKELRELLVTTLDRSGYGPTHKKETTLNINLGTRLDEARKRALAARLDMIDITPEPSA